MTTIKTYTDAENIEYSVFNDGKFKFKIKDVDSGEVIKLVICPTQELAIAKFDEMISKLR